MVQGPDYQEGLLDSHARQAALQHWSNQERASELRWK
jgi:hypothetical protein